MLATMITDAAEASASSKTGCTLDRPIRMALQPGRIKKIANLIDAELEIRLGIGSGSA
jgi:hypothetical protein